VSSQGLQLSTAFVVDGSDNITYVFDPGSDSQEVRGYVRGYVEESLVYLKGETGSSPVGFTVFAFTNLDLFVDTYMSYFKIPSYQREAVHNFWQNSIAVSGYDNVF